MDNSSLENIKVGDYVTILSKFYYKPCKIVNVEKVNKVSFLADYKLWKFDGYIRGLNKYNSLRCKRSTKSDIEYIKIHNIKYRIKTFFLEDENLNNLSFDHLEFLDKYIKDIKINKKNQMTTKEQIYKITKWSPECVENLLEENISKGYILYNVENNEYSLTPDGICEARNIIERYKNNDN